MSQVSVTINGRQFRMACEDGQEDHLMELARELDVRIEGLRAKFGEIGDTRLTVMAALTVADELAEMGTRLKRLEEEMAAVQEARVAAADRAQERAGGGRRGAHRRRRAHRKRHQETQSEHRRQQRRAGVMARRRALHCRGGAAGCVGDNSPGPYDPDGSCPWPDPWVRSHGAHLLM